MKKNKDTFTRVPPPDSPRIYLAFYMYRDFFQNYIKLIYPHPLSPSTHPITFICIHSVTRYGFDQKTDYICNSIDATNSSIRLRRYYYIDASRLKAKKRERERKREHIRIKKKVYTLRIHSDNIVS